MVFLMPSLVGEAPRALGSAGLVLRRPALAHYEAWAGLRQLSRDHLTPYEPEWISDEFCRSSFRRRIRRYQSEMRDGLSHAFFIFRASDDALVGSITLSNIRRGVTQSGMVGYWIGAPYTRRGYATAALRALCGFGLKELGLHRLEAASMPANVGSVAVLGNAGFVREGLARRYLKINGTWEDHVLFALLAEDWARAQAAGRTTNAPAQHGVEAAHQRRGVTA